VRICWVNWNFLFVLLKVYFLSRTARSISLRVWWSFDEKCSRFSHCGWQFWCRVGSSRSLYIWMWKPKQENLINWYGKINNGQAQFVQPFHHGSVFKSRHLEQVTNTECLHFPSRPVLICCWMRDDMLQLDCADASFTGFPWEVWQWQTSLFNTAEHAWQTWS